MNENETKEQRKADGELQTAVLTLILNELQINPDIPKDELFENVLNGVYDSVKIQTKELLPKLYMKVINEYCANN